MSYTLPIFSPDTGTEVFDLAYNEAIEQGAAVTLTVIGHPSSQRSSTKGGYKIYVAVNKEGVQYVGCTCTRLSSRLQLGHRRRLTGKNGYHGYKWLHLPHLQLYVFHLVGLLHPQPELIKPVHISSKIIAERIEAELVYAIRAATGRWPLSQNEIHFHNLAGHEELAKLTTSIAWQMYEKLDLYQP